MTNILTNKKLFNPIIKFIFLLSIVLIATIINKEYFFISNLKTSDWVLSITPSLTRLVIFYIWTYLIMVIYNIKQFKFSFALRMLIFIFATFISVLCLNFIMNSISSFIYSNTLGSIYKAMLILKIIEMIIFIIINALFTTMFLNLFNGKKIFGIKLKMFTIALLAFSCVITINVFIPITSYIIIPIKNIVNSFIITIYITLNKKEKTK